MKILCITGPCQTALDSVVEVFQQSGMQAAKPAQADGLRDITSWHRKLLAAVDDPPSGKALAQPGKLWEQLAGDIFLANVDAPVWGWGDSRSVRLLEFWNQFDPNLYFLLVIPSPEQMLARAMDDIDQAADAAALVGQWRRLTLEALRFHHRHPRRSLLVDADAVSRAAELVAACAERWELPLDAARVRGRASSAAPLALYLAGRLVDQMGDIRELRQEIAATAFGPAGPDPCRLSPDEAVLGYRGLVRRYGEMRQAQFLADSLRAREKVGLESRVVVLEGDVAAMSQALEDKTRRLEQLQGRLAETARERDALAGERVERDSRFEALAARHAEGGETLLLELHKSHVESETFLQRHNKVRQELRVLTARWDRLFRRYPYCYDYGSLELVAVKAGDAPELVWRLADAYLANRLFPELEFAVVLRDGVAGFVFGLRQDSVQPLRLPASGDLAGRSVRLLLSGPPEETRRSVETMLGLGAADWNLPHVLANILIEALTVSGAFPGLDDIQAQAWRAGLFRFTQALASFPPVLRYDRLRLKREQVNASYEHLWIVADNVSLGSWHWPVFEFRLSCAEVGPGHFGTYPKLEFPLEGAKPVLESWYEESRDDFGPKLELRFALPDAVDRDVWQRLSARDQTFLGHLTAVLPDMVARLEAEGGALRRPWREWRALASDIRRIIAACFDDSACSGDVCASGTTHNSPLA